MATISRRSFFHSSNEMIAALSARKLLIGFLAALFLLQLFMVLQFEMSWDEFLLLDWVYDWRDGKITLPLQTIYLRAFTWLPLIAENEIGQIIAARCVMLVFFSVTCALLFAIARRFFSVQAALFAIIFLVSFSFVFRHATSFRMDTLVTTLLTGVLWCLTHPKISYRHIIFAGFGIGLSGMITIKAIFYVPTFAVLLFARWAAADWSKKTLLEGLSVGMISLASFTGLYYLHSLSLNEGISVSNYIFNVAGGGLVETGLFPQFHIFEASFWRNPAYWLLFLSGVGMVFVSLLKGDNWIRQLTILAFALPVLTLVFYRNAYPYYYTFMLAPATVVIAGAIDRFCLKQKIVRPYLLVPIICLTLVPLVVRSFKQSYDYQQQVVLMVHKIFPTPVSYIDRCGMISSFNQKGFFMASWQMSEYYRANKPIMAGIVEQDKPVFVLANIDSLEIDQWREDAPISPLLPEDEAVLSQNYIHHWGPVYVLGKAIDLSSGNANFDIAVAGTYTIETGSKVEIDGVSLSPRSQIHLSNGSHSISASGTPKVTLRWGSNLYKPNVPPIGEQLFRGF